MTRGARPPRPRAPYLPSPHPDLHQGRSSSRILSPLPPSSARMLLLLAGTARRGAADREGSSGTAISGEAGISIPSPGQICDGDDSSTGSARLSPNPPRSFSDEVLGRGGARSGPPPPPPLPSGPAPTPRPNLYRCFTNVVMLGRGGARFGPSPPPTRSLSPPQAAAAVAHNASLLPPAIRPLQTAAVDLRRTSTARRQRRGATGMACRR
uniref:Uncharacterized protein n=1 Tax=Arundo donax TaxID=35708 RepID=A0A0A9DV20_ARUDO